MAGERTVHDAFPPPGPPARPIVLIAAGTLIFLAASFGILIGFFRWQVPERNFTAPRVFPAPRVFSDESDELKLLRAEQERRIQSYRWVNRNKGVIGIPIDRAMQIVAGRGDKGYAPLVPASPSGQMQQEQSGEQGTAARGTEMQRSAKPSQPGAESPSAKPQGKPESRSGERSDAADHD